LRFPAHRDIRQRAGKRRSLADAGSGRIHALNPARRENAAASRKLSLFGAICAYKDGSGWL